MAASSSRVGLRYTLRFRATGGEERLLAREFFVGRVVMEQLKLKVAEVYCIQWNQQEKAFDVTLKDDVIYQRVAESCRKEAKVSPLASYEVVHLDRPNFRLVSIHMYNPFVGDGALATFLGQYGNVTTAARYVKDPLGFWTGRRQYQVLLYPDPEGPDGLMHPPALFSLGADRGYLFYPRQPPFCRKCRQSGHSGGGCTGVPKTCHGCGSVDHLFRNCPSRSKTYAEAAKPTGGPDGATEQEEGSAAAGRSRGSQAQAEAGVAAPESGVKAAFPAVGEAGTDGGALQPAGAGSEAFPALTPSTSTAKAKHGARKVSQAFEAELPSGFGGLVEGTQSKKSRQGKAAMAMKEAGKEGAEQQGKAAEESEEGGALQRGGGSPDNNVGAEGLEQDMGDAATMLRAGLGLEFDLPPDLFMLAPPAGEDVHEGPGGQSDSPNPVVFDWGEQMEENNLYG